MAYGMQLPQMSFPYFYPTKIPPPSRTVADPAAQRPTACHAIKPDAPNATPTVQPQQQSAVLLSPLNFSKRVLIDDDNGNDDDDGDSVNRATAHHQHQHHNHQQQQHRERPSHHSDVSDMEHDDDVDESENVEID